MGYFITDREFTERTFAWQEFLDKKPTADDFSFVYLDNGSGPLLSGITLSPGDVENLFSRTSVRTIKVRFGLDVQPQTTQFNLILFGTDELGEVLTPYYIHESYCWDDSPDTGGPDDGNIPDVLARRWQYYWLAKGRTRQLDYRLFETHYGFIRGYGYPVQELYGALFRFKQFPQVRVHLVLHKYHPVDSSSEGQEAYTFGVFFQGLAKKRDDGSQMDDPDEVDQSGYYDLSAPCPRTC